MFAATKKRLPASPSPPPWYRDDLLPQLQQALGKLADIELGYETKRNRIVASTATEGATRAVAELEGRRRRRRRPWVDRLTELQKQMSLHRPATGRGIGKKYHPHRGK